MKLRSYLVSILLGSFASLVGTGSAAEIISNTQAVSRPMPTPVIQPRVIQASPPVRKAPPAPAQSVDAFLAWDSTTKTETVTNGTPEAHFKFTFTNISTSPVIIASASGSCFCTVAKLPPLPWTNAPGATGQIPVVMNLAGKSGTLPKVVTLVTDKGVKQLFVTAEILAPSAPPRMSAMDRERNQKIAIADRQAVFRGECAKCHAAPAANKMGQPLFVAACGVCHEGEQRASMVPDLHAIAQETSPAYWRSWIAHGKPGSLMPAFAQAEGGILTDAQIASLVSYLTVAIPSRPPSQGAKPQARVH